MNKKLLSLAVAGAIAVPMAAPVLVSTASADEGTGPTVYGRVRLGVQRNEVPGDGNNWGLENDSSRFGIKGTEDLGNGMNVFYRYEFGVNTAEDDSSQALTKRHAYVGLQGNFGALSFGRQTASWYALTGSDLALGNSYTGNYLMYEDKFGDYSGLSDKNSDSIRYQYSVGNFSIGADLVMDQDDQADDLNAYGGAAAYDFGFAKLFGSYIQTHRDGDVEVSAGSQATFDPLTGAFTGSEEIFEDQSREFETEIWSVGASSNITDSIFIYGMYEDGDIEDKTTRQENNGKGAHGGIAVDFTDNIDGFFSYDYVDVGEHDKDYYTLGGQYHISDRTRFYAEFEWTEQNDGHETDTQIVGIRHDF